VDRLLPLFCSLYAYLQSYTYSSLYFFPLEFDDYNKNICISTSETRHFVLIPSRLLSSPRDGGQFRVNWDSSADTSVETISFKGSCKIRCSDQSEDSKGCDGRVTISDGCCIEEPKTECDQLLVYLSAPKEARGKLLAQYMQLSAPPINITIRYGKVLA
jgi:hypothetical protein